MVPDFPEYFSATTRECRSGSQPSVNWVLKSSSRTAVGAFTRRQGPAPRIALELLLIGEWQNDAARMLSMILTVIGICIAAAAVVVIAWMAVEMR
jgi:hypothetical protein